MDIIFATGNLHKALEAGKILGSDFNMIIPKDLGLTDDIPENGETLDENALEKCMYLWNKFGKTCFADDTGLEVDALNGAPGVYTARYSGKDATNIANMAKLIDALKEFPNKSQRKARFRTVIALMINGELHKFQGVLEGYIAHEMVGDKGFGYDPIFIPIGYDCTLAEISLEEKNNISHRGNAMRSLAQFLNSNNAL